MCNVIAFKKYLLHAKTMGIMVNVGYDIEIYFLMSCRVNVDLVFKCHDFFYFSFLIKSPKLALTVPK